MNINDMTDDEFVEYLKSKYGDRWMLVTLTEEEFARCPRPTDEEIREAMEKGLKARNEAIAQLRYRKFLNGK